MNCDDVRNLLKQASEPTAEQYEALASHLDTCSKCQALADEDPFAGSPEWKRALLEVSEASTEDQLLGGPRSFGRRVFDRLWPAVKCVRDDRGH